MMRHVRARVRACEERERECALSLPVPVSSLALGGWHREHTHAHTGVHTPTGAHTRRIVTWEYGCICACGHGVDVTGRRLGAAASLWPAQGWLSRAKFQVTGPTSYMHYKVKTVTSPETTLSPWCR